MPNPNLPPFLQGAGQLQNNQVGQSGAPPDTSGGAPGLVPNSPETGYGPSNRPAGDSGLLTSFEPGGNVDPVPTGFTGGPGPGGDGGYLLNNPGQSFTSQPTGGGGGGQFTSQSSGGGPGQGGSFSASASASAQAEAQASASNSSTVTVSTTMPPTPPPIQLPGGSVNIGVNTLSWPTGATRWATIYLLMSDNQLAKVRKLAYGGSKGYQSLPFTMDVGNGKTITTNLWMLPPRPLSQIKGANGLWLVPLVDDRFWWWYKSEGIITVTEGSTTWAQLYALVATALGINLTVDPIPANYLFPSAAFTTHYEYLPSLLDAIAYSVNQRIVRHLDGTVYAQNATTSQTAVKANLARVAQYQNIQNPSPSAWNIQSGGLYQFVIDPTGNFLLPPPRDLNGLIPTNFLFVFPQFKDGDYNNVEVTVNVPLTGNQPLALNLNYLPGVLGNGFTRIWKDSCTANSTTAGGVLNQTELNNLAVQYATDWILWQTAPVSMRLIATDPWLPEGMSDLIQWVYRPEECSTRVWRGVFNEMTTWVHHASGTVPATTPGSSNQTIYQPGASVLVTAPASASADNSAGIHFQPAPPGSTYPTRLILPSIQSGSGTPSFTHQPGRIFFNQGDVGVWLGNGNGTGGPGTSWFQIPTLGSVNSAFQWVKVTKTFSDFAAASTSNTITIYTAPAGAAVMAIKVKHSVQFTGTFTAYNIQSVATNQATVGGASVTSTSLNCDTAPSASNMAASNVALSLQLHTGTTNITATATSTGGNLNTATQGSVDFWILISKAT